MATEAPSRGTHPRTRSTRPPRSRVHGPPSKERRAKDAHPFARALKRVPSPDGDVRPAGGGGPRALPKREGPAEERSATLEREPRERGHASAEREPDPDLMAFRALPVLQPPAEAGAPAAGSGLERAQAAAMAERLLHSVHVGKVNGEHEVRLGIAGSRVEVRLRQEGERLVPELHLAEGATGQDAATAERLAARLDTELSRAGLDFDPIAIRR